MENPGTSSSQPKSNKVRKVLLVTLLIIVSASMIYYFICGMTYSEGSRSGVLTKVTKKGYIFKTYEGEMNVGGFSQGDGTIMPASVFYFSVRNKEVYDQLEQMQGNKVVVYYRQVIKNFFWQGDTDYFIYKVTEVKH